MPTFLATTCAENRGSKGINGVGGLNINSLLGLLRACRRAVGKTKPLRRIVAELIHIHDSTRPGIPRDRWWCDLRGGSSYPQHPTIGQGGNQTIPLNLARPNRPTLRLESRYMRQLRHQIARFQPRASE